MLSPLPCAAFFVVAGRIAELNQPARELANWLLAREGAPRLECLLVLSPVDARALLEPGSASRQAECLLLRDSGTPIRVNSFARAASFDGVEGHIVLLTEPPAEAAVHGALLLEDVLNSTRVAKIITHKGRILHINRGFSDLFGYTQAECVGTDLDELVLPDGHLYESEMLLDLVAMQGYGSIDTVRRNHAGELFDVSVHVAAVRLGGSARGLIVTYRDISGLKHERARLEHRAQHDALTGLANRALFEDRMERMLDRLRRRPDRRFAVIYLDLNGFKLVNDTFGHAAGDRLLAEVGCRLSKSVRPQDVVARLGGDEFALLIDESSNEADASRVSERIQAELCRPLTVLEREVQVGASMGVVLVSVANVAVQRVLETADAAMYAAKAESKAADRSCHRIVHLG